ncbi:hypothetical protein KW807_00675 [Candidatus Parcubacteria bacterium]|nr:hypothetical protein [Candidatus Parcubacteria bacterium]
MERLLKFIKYNNAVPIALTLILTSSGAAFAFSPEARDMIVDSKEVARSTDNSYLLATDLDNYNFNLQIKDVKEDEENYYVTYSYRLIELDDYAWKNLDKEEILKVSKETLDKGYIKDLGLYTSKEIGDVLDTKLAYLKRVKDTEKEKGLTQKVITTEYSGLIGRIFDPKDKTFPGYAAVIAAEEKPVEEPKLSEEEMRNKVAEILAARQAKLEEEKRIDEEKERLAKEERLRKETEVTREVIILPPPDPEPEPMPPVESTTTPPEIPPDYATTTATST